MTNGEAIKILNEIKFQFELSLSEAELEEEFALEAREDNDGAVKALNLAIQALEKQIPRKLGKSKGAMSETLFNCPSCGKIFFYDIKVDFCQHCGQALDWEADAE